MSFEAVPTHFYEYPKFRSTALASALALTGLLSACGGGGGGSAPTASTSTSSSSTASTPSTTIPAGTTQATPTYAAGSVQLAMFNRLAYYRQTCGFPPVQQNTLLDQATQNHAQYMMDNGKLVTDTEVQGKPGFTGATYQDRADALGWPAGIGVGGGSDSWYSPTTPSAALTPTQRGVTLMDEWATAVYHQAMIDWPFSEVGFGVASTQDSGYAGYMQDLASESYSIDWTSPNDIAAASAPLTFPCDGITGIPYGDSGEVPMPPGASSGGFGTPVSVIGPMDSTVTLTSASMVDTSNGQQINLNILNSDTEPNHLLAQYQASAYPSSPLSPNTTYQVNLSGTINGQAFSRSFTFTTSDVLA